MENFLFSLGVFLVCLTIVVAVHEFGHFIVARAFGVKVIRFSIGFGPALLRYRGATEYVFALIPLGGYVRWYSMEEDQVPANRAHLTFESKPIWQRFLIVLAGPVASILLTFIIYAVTPMLGVKGLAPIVGHVTEGSIADKAGWVSGNEIVSVNNNPTPMWSAVALNLSDSIGEKANVRMHDGRETVLDLSSLEGEQLAIDFFSTLGIKMSMPGIKAIVGRVYPGSPAEDAGVKAGDKIISVDSEPVIDWQQLTDLMRVRANKSISITVERFGANQKLIITPQGQMHNGELIGVIGVTLSDDAIPAELIRVRHHGPLDSMSMAFKRTYMQSLMIIDSIGGLFTGEVSSKDLAGPIGIAQGAANSAEGGIGNFFAFTALFSLMLGILNFLPVPPLDGGRLVMYAYEMIFRSPLSSSVTTKLFQVGVLILVAVSVLAFYNDIQRVVS